MVRSRSDSYIALQVQFPGPTLGGAAVPAGPSSRLCSYHTHMCTYIPHTDTDSPGENRTVEKGAMVSLFAPLLVKHISELSLSRNWINHSHIGSNTEASFPSTAQSTTGGQMPGETDVCRIPLPCTSDKHHHVAESTVAYVETEQLCACSRHCVVYGCMPAPDYVCECVCLHYTLLCVCARVHTCVPLLDLMHASVCVCMPIPDTLLCVLVCSMFMYLPRPHA